MSRVQSTPLPAGLSFGVSIPSLMPDTIRPWVALLEAQGYETLWLGDHVEGPVPMLDIVVQLSQVAALSNRLNLGCGVYLAPLRHPFLMAKQIASLDLMAAGRLIFGVGVGGEFPNEYAACGVPVGERGARLSEAISALKVLWTGAPTALDGRFHQFPEVRIEPPPARPGGPPVWCGGRAEGALGRAGRLGDGWFPYVVTPEMFKDGLDVIHAAGEAAGRDLDGFGLAVSLFCRIDGSREAALDVAADELTQRYKMDFRRATERYVALGRPEEVAERIAAFHDLGVRHVVLDMVSPAGEIDGQIARFAEDVRPLLANRGAAA